MVGWGVPVESQGSGKACNSSSHNHYVFNCIHRLLPLCSSLLLSIGALSFGFGNEYRDLYREGKVLELGSMWPHVPNNSWWLPDDGPMNPKFDSK